MKLTRIFVIKNAQNSIVSVKLKFDNEAKIDEYVMNLVQSNNKVVSIYYVDENGYATTDVACKNN
jgi:hypothetical protein